LKILKKKKQKTKVTGFIMGSDKIYSTTLNGFLIVSSATTGKTEHFKKIGAPNISPLVINNGKLYILTDESKILVLN
jgi:outer membrane protein assembly factor BamB